MTIQSTGHLPDHTAQAPEQTVLDATTFQSWQAELEDFVAVTHNRLQSLSEQLSRGQRVQSIGQDNREIVPHSETTSSTATDCDPSPELADKSQPPVHLPSESEADSPANDVVDDDPMERLNAIKRRLANQMQNAS